MLIKHGAIMCTCIIADMAGARVARWFTKNLASVLFV